MFVGFPDCVLILVVMHVSVSVVFDNLVLLLWLLIVLLWVGSFNFIVLWWVYLDDCWFWLICLCIVALRLLWGGFVCMFACCLLIRGLLVVCVPFDLCLWVGRFAWFWLVCLALLFGIFCVLNCWPGLVF